MIIFKSLRKDAAGIYELQRAGEQKLNVEDNYPASRDQIEFKSIPAYIKMSCSGEEQKFCCPAATSDRETEPADHLLVFFSQEFQRE
jgi:hypothetical protein